MTSKTWHDIWEAKQVSKGFDFATAKVQETLKELLSCNGFNSATGSFSLHAYQNFIAKIFAQARLESASSLYEVGCGAGAFLYALNACKATQNTESRADCEAIPALMGGGGAICLNFR